MTYDHAGKWCFVFDITDLWSERGKWCFVYDINFLWSCTKIMLCVWHKWPMIMQENYALCLTQLTYNERGEMMLCVWHHWPVIRHGKWWSQVTYLNPEIKQQGIKFEMEAHHQLIVQSASKPKWMSPGTIVCYWSCHNHTCAWTCVVCCQTNPFPLGLKNRITIRQTMEGPNQQSWVQWRPFIARFIIAKIL